MYSIYRFQRRFDRFIDFQMFIYQLFQNENSVFYQSFSKHLHNRSLLNIKSIIFKILFFMCVSLRYKGFYKIVFFYRDFLFLKSFCYFIFVLIFLSNAFIFFNKTNKRVRVRDEE